MNTYKRLISLSGTSLIILCLGACEPTAEEQQSVPLSEEAAVVDQTVTVVPESEPVVKAYGRFVPEREDDFTWENDKVAFRVYGPSSGGKGQVSGVDAWFKKVPYSIIDKWYAGFLEGKSYHEEIGRAHV